MDLLEALDDPLLFAPHFRGETWDRWRVFLRALFGLPLDAEELAVYTEHTGRTDAPARAVSEAALIVGRRGGKSRILALVAVFLATFRDYSEYLAPGEVGTVAVIAANRPQARAIFRYASGLLKAVGLLAPMVADETTEAIELTNRTRIEIGTASYRVVRGYTIIAALCDEIAFWRTEESASNPDVEILRALRPGLASIPGAMLLLASSPYAKRGELYGAYRRHFGRDGARVLVWKADTASMNPAIDRRVLAEAYEDDPEAARAEYGAEFRDDLADFVTRETVEAAICRGRRELPRLVGIDYAGFCDPSGGISDAMTLAIGHLEAGAACVLDAVLEIMPPFDPEVAVAECAALLRRFGVSKVTGDRYAGEWPRARFREYGIAFEQSARPKSDLYRELLPLLNAKRVELLDNPRLTVQLIGLERRTARSGRDSIDHAPGGHDDLANAVAGVLVNLDLDRRPALLRPDDLVIDNTPVPVPQFCEVIVAMLAADMNGQCGLTFWAYSPHAGDQLTLCDFEGAPLSRNLFDGIASRLDELTRCCRARRTPMLFSTNEPLMRQAHARGVNAEVVPPPLIADPARLAFAAAGHVLAGNVRIAVPAHERARTSPLGSALTIRGGENMDDPLRLSLLAAIAVCLDDASQSREIA